MVVGEKLELISIITYFRSKYDSKIQKILLLHFLFYLKAFFREQRFISFIDVDGKGKRIIIGAFLFPERAGVSGFDKELLEKTPRPISGNLQYIDQIDHIATCYIDQYCSFL